MTLPNLVSFSGFANSGKDVAADILVQRARFAKTYMAKPLEEALVKLNPWMVDQKENSLERFEELYAGLGDQAIKDFEEARRMLLVLEKEIGRRNGANIWKDEVFDEVRTFLALDKKVALAGVQYLDELLEVRELGGVCVWLSRPGKFRGGSHITPEDCDFTVINDGTPKDLYVKIVVALEEYDSKKKENDNVG